jgi:hypothetical protein
VNWLITYIDIVEQLTNANQVLIRSSIQNAVVGIRSIANFFPTLGTAGGVEILPLRFVLTAVHFSDKRLNAFTLGGGRICEPCRER